jgi:hypothetical protein
MILYKNQCYVNVRYILLRALWWEMLIVPVLLLDNERMLESVLKETSIDDLFSWELKSLL